MMSLFRWPVALTGALLAVSPAAAQTTAPADGTTSGGTHVSVALTGGTLGIGPELGVRLADHVGVRANATFFGFSGDFDSDDIAYRGKLNLESYGAMVDLYPMGGHFRLSAGARINRNRAGVDATPTGTVTVGGEDYTQAQVGTLRGRAGVKKLAPALTLGWGGSNRSGFAFGFDAGVLFQGAVRLREFTATGTLANDPGFRASLEQERRDLQDDIDSVKIYPIVQATIGYRF